MLLTATCNNDSSFSKTNGSITTSKKNNGSSVFDYFIIIINKDPENNKLEVAKN